MTDLRQAAQQALEALIDAANVLSAPMFADAADALRKALEQPEQEPVAFYHPQTSVDVEPLPLYTQPSAAAHTSAAPEWEAIDNIIAEYGLQAIDFVADWKATMAEQQCQWPKCQTDDHQKALAEQTQQELFTGRPWVDMTDEEMDTTVNSNITITDSKLRDGVWGVMLDTAALLKEKNT